MSVSESDEWLGWKSCQKKQFDEVGGGRGGVCGGGDSGEGDGYRWFSDEEG